MADSKLYEAMAKAFPSIEGATKDSNNPAFRSKYADLSSVVEAIKPALVLHGLFFTQHTHEQQGGVCIETVVHHASGESLSFGKLFVPASKQDAQGYGSALTYARRYSLMTAFGVCPEDDDGNAASRPTAARQEPEVQQRTTAPPRPKPVALTGKHKTRAALRAVAGEIRDKLNEAADGGDVVFVDEVLTTYADDILQIQEEGPADWWEHRDYGLKYEIDKARIRASGETRQLEDMVRS